MFKKTIEIFQMDGDSNERLVCKVSNWDGIGYKIPKSKLKESSNRDELKYTGIYLLIGENEENSSVYIGEAENVYQRLLQHIDEDSWNTAIAFIRKDNGLNKAYVKYMENYLYHEAKQIGRYDIVNPNIPAKSGVSESQEEELKEFMQYSKMITNILGYKIFEEIIKKEEKKESNKLYINTSKVKATGILTTEGFVVLKGSTTSKIYTKSTTPCLVKTGRELEEKGIIVDNKFTKDHLFASPSGAAVAILKRNANGFAEWKTKEGKTLKEILEKVKED